ncbi:MAG: arginine ABC transporter permease ArtM [Aeromonas sp.]
MLDYLLTLLGGLALTLQLTVASLGFGLTLALLMTWVLSAKWPLATQLVQFVVLLFTGTPLLIQIFLIYYGPGQFAWLKESFLWAWFKQPWFCAVLALGLNTAAYSTRLFKGALEAIPAGEVEACRALGFSPRQTLWMKTRHAARRLVPAYSNEVILVLKGSSLASTITLMDIMGLAQQLNARTYDTLAVFTAAGVLYLSMNGLLTLLFRWCERRALAYQN